MESISLEFSLRLFLLIYSRIIVIDKYGVFTALEKDVHKLGIKSKFYYWNENDFCKCTTICDLQEACHRVHK